MLLHWEETLKKTVGNPHLRDILLDNGPIAQDLFAQIQCSVNKGRIQNIIYRHPRSPLTRDEEPWSQIEQVFLVNLVSYSQDQDTLREIAITLHRSMDNCRTKWEELTRQVFFLTKNTTLNLTETDSDQARIENFSFQWTEWEKAMIALWIAKLQTLDRTTRKPKENPTDFYRDIAETLHRDTYLGKRFSEYELTRKIRLIMAKETFLICR